MLTTTSTSSATSPKPQLTRMEMENHSSPVLKVLCPKQYGIRSPKLGFTRPHNRIAKTGEYVALQLQEVSDVWWRVAAVQTESKTHHRVNELSSPPTTIFLHHRQP
ncbi:hypothetical protein ALUC_70333A [Aspergillus luchuensis]|nr:hypothetical protein ALUC_70333A [Aspergillus luchuensis]